MSPLKRLNVIKAHFREKRIDLSYPIFFFVLLVLPLVTSSRYVFHLFIIGGMYCILAQSYNLVLGYVGLLSFAHAAFFGIGAYTSALLAIKLGVPYIVGFFLAGIAASICAYFIALLALRTSYHHFAFITLALALMIQLVFKNWVALTGGPMGVTGIPHPSLNILNRVQIEVGSPLGYYYFMLLLVVVCVLISYRLVNSRIGRAFLSVRENPMLAESFGINIDKFKVMAFVISAFFAGWMGSFYAHYILFISPDVFALSITVTALVMVLVGGRGTMEGVFFGSYILYIIPELLRIAPEWREILYGVFLFLFVVFMPEGIAGKLRGAISGTKEVLEEGELEEPVQVVKSPLDPEDVPTSGESEIGQSSEITTGTNLPRTIKCSHCGEIIKVLEEGAPVCPNCDHQLGEM